MIDDGVLTMLLNTNKNLSDYANTLQASLDDMELVLEEERELRQRFEREAEGVQELVRAARDYLSWKEYPPTKMDVPTYSGIEQILRSALEQALRKLES